jgi:DNA-binding transcriptional regulator YiaG
LRVHLAVSFPLDKYSRNDYIIFMKGNDLKKWRQRWGFSQARLAKLFGVDVITVSRWERGVQEPTPLLSLALEALEHRIKEASKNGFIGGMSGMQETQSAEE